MRIIVKGENAQEFFKSGYSEGKLLAIRAFFLTSRRYNREFHPQVKPRSRARHYRACLMRLNGATYDEIGLVLGLSKERVRQILVRFFWNLRAGGKLTISPERLTDRELWADTIERDRMRVIDLGSEVVDVVTGFKGVVTSRAIHMNGCDRYWVQPKVVEKKDESAKYPDGCWVDITTLKVVKEAIDVSKATEAKPERKPGGFSSRLK